MKKADLKPPEPEPEPKPDALSAAFVCTKIATKYEGFGPPHKASVNCESGKRNHCTCDTCF
jgi:hypothetical protein